MIDYNSIYLWNIKFDNICFICGETDKSYFNNHHKIPKILEGSDEIYNKAILCDGCHNIIHYDSKSKFSHSDLVKISHAKKKEKIKIGKDTWKGRGKDKKPRKKRGSPNDKPIQT